MISALITYNFLQKKSSLNLDIVNRIALTKIA
jgi:hypothetical protein